jgi:diguanylate cyclase (GGDEF)-like protein
METTAMEAFEVADRLVKAVREHPVVVEGGKTLAVTISAGVATLGSDDTEVALMVAADKALYTAKKEGRDRAMLAS